MDLTRRQIAGGGLALAASAIVPAGAQTRRSRAATTVPSAPLALVHPELRSALQGLLATLGDALI